eukprot:NODE_279_length_10886_cov_0.340039.p9 type:complete len:148 gc:universal NODE_279_length_10886_cov_0.340039:3971-3528(-)
MVSQKKKYDSKKGLRKFFSFHYSQVRFHEKSLLDMAVLWNPLDFDFIYDRHKNNFMLADLDKAFDHANDQLLHNNESDQQSIVALEYIKRLLAYDIVEKAKIGLKKNEEEMAKVEGFHKQQYQDKIDQYNALIRKYHRFLFISQNKF